MKKFHSSARFQKRLSHFFTYFFLLLLSVIIIYPLLITASTAFKSGNIAAFSLDFSSDWTLGNFTRLFSETLYGTWYKNTLIISVLTMIVQVTVVTLAGYTYSRYRRSEEHTSELQSRFDLVCRLLLEKKKKKLSKQ